MMPLEPPLLLLLSGEAQMPEGESTLTLPATSQMQVATPGLHS